LFSAGGESTASLLGTAVTILATQPELQRALRDDRELMPIFIEETLRLEPPFRAHHRHVLHDTELAGCALPKDSRILLLWGAANRDPVQFDVPDELRLDRPKTKGHMTFGKGLHFCLGASLARLEASTVLGLLLERTTWFDAVEVGPWLPSVLARRREYLQLAVR
jgi:cytochrome P450